jgi:hypothetical protein
MRMDIRIKGTEDVRELTAIDRVTGLEWTADLISAGNLPRDDNERPIMDAEDYEWWATYISDSEETEREAEQLSAEIGVPVGDILEACGSEGSLGDMDQHRAAAIRVMATMRSEAANK